MAYALRRGCAKGECPDTIQSRVRVSRAPWARASSCPRKPLRLSESGSSNPCDRQAHGVLCAQCCGRDTADIR
eukprot:124987-Prymnesium_polylepis.2